jgi:hypothetical protein
MNRNDFPNWIFVTHEKQPYAFANLSCTEGFKVAVRVGWDGVCVFGREGLSPSLYYMNQHEYAVLADFKGSNGIGFKAYEVGAVRLNGSLWFSDCMYEPGLINKDFQELKSLLLLFAQDPAQRNPEALYSFQ